jgi:hypothetical protein
MRSLVGEPGGEGATSDAGGGAAVCAMVAEGETVGVEGAGDLDERIGDDWAGRVGDLFGGAGS